MGERITTTKAVGIAGHGQVAAGETVEVSSRDAAYLIAIGKANRAAIQDAKPPPTDEADEPESEPVAKKPKRGRPRKTPAAE